MAGPDPKLRELPSVNEMLARPSLRALVERVGRTAALQAIRGSIAEARERIQRGEPGGPDLVTDEAVAAAVQRLRAPRLRPVLNATGVVLDTNLGRAPLHPE